MEEPHLWARVLGRVVYEFTLIQPMLTTYLHLIASALFPIYAGAHASLVRPTSAAKPPKRERSQKDSDSDNNSDDEDEKEHRMEGLSPVDALLMPLFAGTALAGLYFLIKWLDDPTLLNKALNAYFALFGVFSVSKLAKDVLDFGHSLVFPRRYALDGGLYHVFDRKREAIPVSKQTEIRSRIESPLPGRLARLPLPASLRRFLWNDRAMPSSRWAIRLYLHRVFAGKLMIGPHGILSAIFGLGTVVYFNLVDKPWYLTNLMGFGFSYGALQLISPTTFATGSLILGTLFFYDVYFVFYTPMMVTVARTLDVPIKLVFPRPALVSSVGKERQYAMLGLGDVVLPGIMIGLALRFDLFIFYLRRQTRKNVENGAQEEVEKPKYHTLSGRYSDYFWTHSFWLGRPLVKLDEMKHEPPFTFPKTYFTASLIGYLLGMLTTLSVMHIWDHAQPALLYLVPGVLGSLWITALVRGELKMMWDFSEVEEDQEVQKDEDGNDKSSPLPQRSSIFSLDDKKEEVRKERTRKALEKYLRFEDEHADNAVGESIQAKETERGGKKHRPSKRELFSFSIEAPWDLEPSPIVAEKKQHVSDPDKTPSLVLEDPSWTPTVDTHRPMEPSGKRSRYS